MAATNKTSHYPKGKYLIARGGHICKFHKYRMEKVPVIFERNFEFSTSVFSGLLPPQPLHGLAVLSWCYLVLSECLV